MINMYMKKLQAKAALQIYKHSFTFPSFCSPVPDLMAWCIKDIPKPAHTPLHPLFPSIIRKVHLKLLAPTLTDKIN